MTTGRSRRAVERKRESLVALQGIPITEKRGIRRAEGGTGRRLPTKEKGTGSRAEWTTGRMLRTGVINVEEKRC